MVKYITGPRGGKYYRKNGRKVYVKSTKRKSRSPKRRYKSTKRKSTKRKSRSPKRRYKSTKRKSTKRNSPKRRYKPRLPMRTTDTRCQPTYTKKYLTRPGPPAQANSPGCRDLYATGNDGRVYQSRQTSSGSYRWFPLPY